MELKIQPTKSKTTIWAKKMISIYDISNNFLNIYMEFLAIWRKRPTTYERIWTGSSENKIWTPHHVHKEYPISLLIQ